MKVLRRLKPRVTHLTDFYVIDVETGKRTADGIQWHLNARPESFIFGVIYGHNFSQTIHSLDEFKTVLQGPRFRKKKVFAHNATYDLTTLYGSIFDLDGKALFVGSRFISCTNGNCVFADSLNIVRTSVKELGKMIGIEKPDLGDAAMFSKEVGAAEINRCYEDCRIVWEALFNIFEFAGNIKITQASLSMTYFRSYHQKFDIQHNEHAAEFWNSYYGGRTEVFKIGPTHSSVIDVNSMYPYIMRTAVFPNPKLLKVERPTLKRALGIIQHYEGCVTCTVEHSKTWLGYLPVRHQNKLCFPVGTLKGTWNFNELRFALSAGVVRVTAVEKIVYAEPMESPFIGYVDDLYAKRFATKNPFEIYRIKIFMNSLYGKFAQRNNEETEYIRDLEAQYDTIRGYQKRGRLIKIVGFNDRRKDCFLVLKRPWSALPSFAIPSFASYITSGARVVLLKKLLSMEHSRPVYVDTDSIFYEVETGTANEYHLGGWKKENKIITQIDGLKNYRYQNEETGKAGRRLKGVPMSAIETGPMSYEYYNLLQTKEALRRGLPAGVLTKRIKELTGKYDKRIVYDDGQTDPITL